MAKKTPAKKPRRRLKRSIRRSLSAVLMITAIAVAAIPVPENVAAPDDIITPADSYTETINLDRNNIPYETATNTIYSLTIYEGGLYWQYRIDTDKQKVLQYNNNFPSISLTMSQRVPTNYTYVKKSEYDTFCTKTYTLDQDNYGTSDAREAKRFFDQYFATDSEYMDFLAAMEEGSNASISRGVYDLNDVNRRSYYCSLNHMADYILEPVRNEISAADTAVLNQISQTSTGTIEAGDQLYIPKYIGSDTSGSEDQDSDGYLLYSGTMAFGNTQRISHIGNYAFAGNGILRSIDLPNWLQSIGKGAFMECSYLEAVSIPFLSEIPDGAFKNCSSLRTVNWWSEGNSSGLTSIGKEAFYGTGIQENVSGQGIVRFPIGVETIDDAAFYGCGALQQIEFDTGASTTSKSVSINQYAFYDNTALNSVLFNSKSVKTLGDYCFAIGVNTNALQKFTFPNSPFTTGEGILAKRTALTDIVVPANAGNLTNKDTSNFTGILEGCTGLRTASFEGINTSYSPNLFDSVMQEDFYVTGPARMTTGATVDNVKDASQPRRSTWHANKTAANQYIPYLYNIGGKDYYEICSDGKYLESIDKATGTLTSCDLMEGADVDDGELVIPDKVGTTNITKIDSDCFKGRDKLKNAVTRLTIGNNITDIADGVFDSWSNLSKVDIGRSIQNIGSRAFANCVELHDVTFATPENNNYELLNPIGADAFATNSGKLTIHGDLVDGYAPFEYATSKDNFISSTKVGNTSKFRILYQSRWDSPSSKHMSVIYGEHDDGNGYVTLIDYPLYQDFYGDGGLSADLEEYNRTAERNYYESYGNYTYPSEEDAELERKVKFARAYVDNPNDDTLYGADADNAELTDALGCGPWVNPSFCNNYTKWLTPELLERYQLAPIQDMNSLPDNPAPYFEKHPYNFLDNYLRYDGEQEKIKIPYLDGWTTDEANMMQAVEDIVIPKGVESIDLKGYYYAEVDSSNPANQNVASNRDNYITYFGNSSDTNRNGIFVYNVPKENAGLFSGNIDDLYSSTGDIDVDEHRKGNDRIKSVNMSQSDIKSIPDYAFDDCELLESVLISEGCEVTGKLPFRGCGKLITLVSSSEDVPAQNGILYQKKDDGSYELVECILAKGANGEGSIISAADDDPYLSQVSSIGESAFENCAGITSVDLSSIDNGAASNKLKAIPDKCFKNCDKLSRVILPLATNDIGQEAFADIREEQYYGNNLPDSGRLEVTLKGNEVNISETAFDPKKDTSSSPVKSTLNLVTIWTYEDSAAERYVLEQQKLGYDIRLGNEGQDHKDHQYLGKSIRVNFWDWNGNVLCDTIYLADDQKRIEEENIPAEVIEIVNEENHRPGYKFAGWLGDNGIKIGERITTDEVTYVAQYESDGTTVNGRYTVEFYDGITWKSLKGLGAKRLLPIDANNEMYVYYVDAGSSFDDMTAADPDTPMSAPDNPSQPGYTFSAWQDASGNTWADAAAFNTTKITKNMRVVALYTADNGGNSNTSNNSTNNNGSGNSTNNNGSGNSTNNNGSGNSTNTSRNTTSSSNNTTSSSTSSSSTSTSSTTSGSNSTATKYTVTVDGGEGSGSYDAGATVIISAHDPAAGMAFQRWTTESNGVTLASVSMPITTFVMPANNVTVKANYVAATNTVTPTSTTGGTGGGTTDGGNTRVDITKPGISNKDLATANVNGSTDNFIIKITETDEATRAVADALTNKYGSLDNILYYAMDISLWDATGTYKLTGDQLAGISVDITIPIPDALVAYGGNNMAGAVINGNQLENLNENFTTINGVPCIRFTATHFSPYTVYVDTGNLTEGMLDATPKTGDPIHPKWFLSIGLACLSIVLFMKKDKAAKVKTA